VVGAVEEEAATSRGARFIAARFGGERERVPDACIIGEPSRWHRVTLGYKGRLLLDLAARQPMAHTAGPDPGIASLVVDLWSWIVEYAAAFNKDRDKPFDQLAPSLRRFITGTAEMTDTVDAQVAWRLPMGFDPDKMVAAMLTWAAGHVGADTTVEAIGIAVGLRPGAAAQPRAIEGPRTALEFRFRGFEHPWRGDRQNTLVRSFLAAIRAADPSAQPGFVLKTGTSDMNVVAPVWRCPIVAYGPGDSSLDHTPNEHLSLDEYWRAIDVIEAAVRTLAES
jgi:LysW-gamma-L-lysine carboxypeptidase